MSNYNTPDPTDSKEQFASNNTYRKSALTKLFLISAVGVGLSLITSAKLVATNLADKAGQDSVQPQVLVGSVNKSLEQFSFTTEQGVQYHISDPSNIIDDLAKKRGVIHPFYELHRVRVKALISKAGNYGHMGHYERQITVVGLAER